MRALLKTHLVDEVMHELHGIFPACFESSYDASETDTLVEVFEKLQLPLNEDMASDHDTNRCFCVHVGAWTSLRFIHCVELQLGSSHLMWDFEKI